MHLIFTLHLSLSFLMPSILARLVRVVILRCHGLARSHWSLPSGAMSIVSYVQASDNRLVPPGRCLTRGIGPRALSPWHDPLPDTASEA